jgi:hypothetical protein
MADTSHALTVLPSSGVDTYRMSTDAASISKAIVIKTAMEIQGRKYVKVEGWQAIALAHGCTASSCNVERVDGGFRATGQVRRMDTGAVIAEAEGFVGEDEAVWFGGEVVRFGKRKVHEKRPDYAIRAMAQTRSISRACRSAFAHVVVMMDAGLSTTPAEEVPLGGFDDEPRHPGKAQTESLKVDPADAAMVQGNGENQYKADRFKTAVAVGWKTTNKTPRGRDDQILAYLDMAVSPDHINTILKVNEEHIRESERRDDINESANNILQWFTDQAAKGQAA